MQRLTSCFKVVLFLSATLISFTSQSEALFSAAKTEQLTPQKSDSTERQRKRPSERSSEQSAKRTPISLTIQGLSGELQKNVEARISSLPKGQYQNSLYFRNRVQEEIELGVKALGYYEAKVTFDYNETKHELIATVKQGKPIYVKEIEVNLTFAGDVDSSFDSLLESALKNKGEILNQGHYDGFKSSLESLALSQGYFDAELTKSQLGISIPRHEAFWWIDYNLKDRYRFGKITFRNSQIRDSYLQNISPFTEGEYYTAKQLALLNYNLSATNWFESVTVIPLRNRAKYADKSMIMPILVDLEPKKKNKFDVGIGYASDNGARGSLRWTKPWINNRGHSFQAYTEMSKVDKEYSLNYKIPLHKSAIYDYYTIQGKYKKVDNNDTYSKSYTFGAVRNWDRLLGWQRSLGLNSLYDDFTQADESYKTFLLYPSASLSKVVSDDSIFPLNGHLQRYSAEVASKSFLSDIYLFRLQMQQVWIASPNDSNRFVMRANVGLMNSNDFDRVPPSFRFFVGGERSIRGYSYQSIAPKNKQGKLIGGSRLLTGTLEYNYKVAENWWSAVFVDSGEATDKFTSDDFYTGAGVGIRWVSPVGPIKLDIASPVGKDKKGVHFYIGLGTDL